MTFSIDIYIAVICAIIFRLVIMKGSFVLPTFYKSDGKMTFNLGSLGTILIGLVGAFVLMYSSPDLFTNVYVAAMTAYTAPQIVDGVVTAGTRYTNSSEDENSSIGYSIDDDMEI